MIDDEHSGIANILNLPVRNPVRNKKFNTQVTPELTNAEILMSIKPLSLPKTKPEPKDEFGYTKKQNKEIIDYITKPKVLSNNINKKKVGVLDYIEKTKKNYNDTGVEYVGKRSDNPSWMKDLEKTGPYGNNNPILKNYENRINNRFVNKTLNKYENQTVNKSVVTFDPTTQLFTDDTRNIAFKSYNDAKRWNDAVNQEPTATPKQVNDLKERLDNTRAFGYSSEDQKDNRKQKVLNQTNKNRRLI
tara:strand:+ start:474 stop:1211 length:738 start_codon:yes stop_codon:yes gene_type:complete